MAEPKLQARRDLMEGYVLAPDGATIGDAIRTADISIPSYRQRLMKKDCLILTQFGMNDRPAEHTSEPPTRESCERAIREIEARKPAVLHDLKRDLSEMREELKNRDINRMERSFWRTRVRDLERRIEQIESEHVTGEELYRALVREDVTIRARAVPPEMRAAMEAIERERALVGAGAPAAAGPTMVGPPAEGPQAGGAPGDEE